MTFHIVMTSQLRLFINLATAISAAGCLPYGLRSPVQLVPIASQLRFVNQPQLADALAKADPLAKADCLVLFVFY